MKNWGIGMSSCVSRAAIQGGLDPQHAFLMTNLYIQKMELMQDISTVERLVQEMILDFAEQVEKLRLLAGNGSQFCRLCVQYISQNIFSSIRIENMAKELGYNRSYMCSHFTKEMGVTLNQYIQQEKVEEAKRLLQFSDRNLSEIASLLSFSSQSHFQTVFKKMTGETPLLYRKQMKIMSEKTH
ncbi:AraC family transcriptional regulator [Faecalicatena contorta]|nr:AraC family transcriptional regulator [Faecalicatena contorta]